VLGKPRQVVEGTPELERLFVSCTIPTSYQIEGVVRDGDHSQHVSQAIEIWKGGYKGEVVALKVLKISRQNPDISEFTRVSTPRDSRGGLLIIGLTDDTEYLQGIGVDESGQARERPPLLRGVDDHRHFLPGVSLVRKREHRGLSAAAAKCQSIRSGQ